MKQQLNSSIWDSIESQKDVQATKQPCYPYPFEIVVNTRIHSIVGNYRRYGFLPLVCCQTVDKKSTRLFDATKILSPLSGERIDAYFERLDKELQRKYNNGELIG